MNWPQKHELLASEMRALQQFLTEYARHLGPPMFCESEGDDRGYHFLKPDLRHFCLLKASKGVVSWKSAQIVALAGFHTEVISLLRVSVEAATLTKWAAMSARPDVSNAYRDRVTKVVRGYFDDYNRNPKELPIPLKINITDVHKMLSEVMTTDPSVRAVLCGADPNELQKSLYVRFSKYVHAGYPETIDLFGESLGELGLSGSTGSFTKDSESYEAVEVIFDAVRNAVAHIPLVLDQGCLGALQPRSYEWLSRYTANEPA